MLVIFILFLFEITAEGEMSRLYLMGEFSLLFGLIRDRFFMSQNLIE